MAKSGVRGQRVVSPALVGRADELARVAAAIIAPPAVVVVDGEAGIGKTRLLSELAHRPEIKGRRLLVGRCHRIRESFPLGPVIEAFRGVQADVADGTVAASWSPVVGALHPLLPELAEQLPPAPMRLDDRAAERHRVFRALVEVLRSLGPAVLALEDLHWADEHTVEFVSYLLTEAGHGELATVLTFRGDEVGVHVRSAIAKLPASMRRTDVVLRPLDVQQTGELAAAIVEADDVSYEFASYLCERTSGLPLAIEELLALLQTQGKLVRRGGSWARRTLEELDVPTGIRDPVRERVSRISSAARAVVEAAAVLQVPVLLDTLVATCRGASSPSTAAAVEEAIESGLLAEHGDAVGFRHLLAAQAVYEDIPGPRQRDLHGRAARALEALTPVPLGQVAHHLRHAGLRHEWVDAAERAADQALALGHIPEAFRLLQDMLGQADLDPHRRGRLAVRLGHAAIETLQAAEVLDLLSGVLDQVLEHDLPPAMRGELRFRVGMLLHEVGGDQLRVHQLLTEAVTDLEECPQLQAWVMLVLGMPPVKDVTVKDLVLTEHRGWLTRALAVLPRIDDPSFVVFALGKVAMVLAPIGNPQWRELTTDIEQRTDRIPRHRNEVNAFWSVGTQASCVGDHATAGRLLTAGLAGAEICDNRRLALSVRAALAMLNYFRGSWQGLAEEVDRLIEDLAEHPRSRVDVEIVAGGLALARGELDKAQQWLDGAVDRCLEFSGFDMLAPAAACLIRVRLARGEVDAAVAAVRKWFDLDTSQGVWATDFRAAPAAVAALIRAGQVGQARALIDRFAGQLSELDAPLAPAAMAYARGLLDAAEGRVAAASAHLIEAAGGYEALACPYESALAAEQAAVCLFAAGDDVSAREQLHRALSEFRRLDAPWDGRRCTSLARQHGMSVPGQHRGGRKGYGDQLSPRETEVAALAATGHSNKEIAAQLFLSVNTVGRHISAAMRKLEVRSRAALAHRLVGPDDQQN